jgi:predicted enzyme related to lactoylglutathione lyase
VCAADGVTSQEASRTPFVPDRCQSSAMAIARFPVVVLDCSDPRRLAQFYSALLDWPLVRDEPDMCFIRAEYGDGIGFQRVEGFAPPQWPTQEKPQQMHIDVNVDDLDVAEAAVLELGATKHDHQPGTTFRVFLDPAGHPFCLCAE